jgi:DnaA family protein
MASVQVVEQLPLSVQLRDDATFENFYSGDAQEIVDQMQLSASGKGEQSVYVSGPSGVGCSHLLQAACHQAEASGLNSVYLPLEELVAYSPAIFESLEELPLIALDNLQAVAGQKQWEEALFHLFNRVRDSGGRLLFAADCPLEQLGIELPDLLSRLQWGLVYSLPTQDDEFKVAALQYRARNRGIELNEDVAKYVVKQVAGDMETLFTVLQELDNASLSAKKKLTRPFVKSVMDW